MKNKHLFIVCMNNSGSTALQESLIKCERVVGLPRQEGKESRATSSEGQVHAAKYMPIPWKNNVDALWTEKEGLFRSRENYDWSAIRSTWNDLWRKSSKYKDSNTVLLEKSPPNVLRAALLQEQFDNSYFLIMVRNPYATCEGMRRRYGKPLARAARHWCSASRHQMNNIKSLKNSFWFTYEQLCNKQKYIEKNIIELMPELHDFSLSKKVGGANSIEGKGAKKIKSYNDRQINNLSKADIRTINAELRYSQNVMKYFGYSMRY